MSFYSGVEQSTLRGSVKDWMAPTHVGASVQPWYTPLDVNPLVTGMAVGGIGSTFTVAVDGSVPCFDFVAGSHVRARPGEVFGLNTFYLAERRVGAARRVAIPDDHQFHLFNRYHPILAGQGRLAFQRPRTAREELQWLRGGAEDFPEHKHPPLSSHEQCLEQLEALVGDPGLYERNVELIRACGFSLSQRTVSLLAAQPGSRDGNLSLLLDIYAGRIELEPEQEFCLTGLMGGARAGFPAPYPAERAQYAALYPIAVTDYAGATRCEVRRVQFSPVVKANAELSALPVSYTWFELKNPTAEPLEVVIVQTIDNLVGAELIKMRPGAQDCSYYLQRLARGLYHTAVDVPLCGGGSVRGVLLGSSRPAAGGGFDGAMAVAARGGGGATVSVKPTYYASAAAAVVRSALRTGVLDDEFRKGEGHSGRELLQGAICVTVVVPAGGFERVEFATVVDFPNIELPGYCARKRYTQRFPDDAGRALALLQQAFEQQSTICEEIAASHQTLLAEGQRSMPVAAGGASSEWRALATLQINQLSLLADSTIWDASNRFLVRECVDYAFLNSLDVYFYGAFAISALFPEVDAANMVDFAHGIASEDMAQRTYNYLRPFTRSVHAEPRLRGPRHPAGVVVHDMGSCFDARPNAYDFLDSGSWKDLAPKYALMLLRSYELTRDRELVTACWPALRAGMERLLSAAHPTYRIPLTHGIDDTFDNIPSFGISVYCASLWVAGLRALARLATLQGEGEANERYTREAERACTFFVRALWDDAKGYYRYCASPLDAGDFAEGCEDELRRSLGAVYPLAVTASDDVNLLLFAFVYDEWDDALLLTQRPAILARLAGELPDDAVPSCLVGSDRRRFRKLWLYAQLRHLARPSCRSKLFLDSDDVFSDQLLADTYLLLTGLAPITPRGRRRRALEKVWLCSYQRQASLLGASCLVHEDGSVLSEPMAQDVWIGVQFSIAAAMIASGMPDEARELISAQYRLIYDIARVPFGIPESFSNHCRVDAATLAPIGADRAATLVRWLSEAGFLRPDGSISAAFPRGEPTVFAQALRSRGATEGECSDVYAKLLPLQVRHTVGRYFRPGMMHSLSQVARFVADSP